MPEKAGPLIKKLKLGNFFPQLDEFRQPHETIIACVIRFMGSVNDSDQTTAIMMIVGYAQHSKQTMTATELIDGLQSSVLFQYQRPTIEQKLHELIKHGDIHQNKDSSLSIPN